MDKENIKEIDKVEKLVSDVIECAEVRFAINVQDKMAEIISSVAAVVVLAVLVTFAVFLLSIGAAMGISQYFKSSFFGFLFMAMFYLILAGLIYFTRKNWIKLPIINALIKKINFHEED